MAAARSLLLRVGRRSMRRDLNQNQTPRATAIPTQSTVASNNFVVAPASKPLLLSLLSFVALSPVASPGTYVALNGQRLSPRISLAITPVSPEYQTNLCYHTEIESRVRGPIASLNSLVEASPAKPRQLFAAAFRPKGRRTLSQSSSRVCCREGTRT